MPTSNRINFTKETIEAIAPPEKGRVTYHDTNKKASGLQLRVTSTGTKTFCVFRRMNGGNPDRVTLGRFPLMTLEQARKQAALISASIANGDNPAEVKRAHKAEPTFGELFDEYIERHAKPNKRTWEEDVQRFNQYLKKPLASKKIKAVDRNSLSTLHGDITNAGHPTVANRVLALVSSVFGWAINAGRADANPASGLRRNREKSRDRFLQGDEIPRFFTALAAEENPTIRDYFLLSLLTGMRRSNVLSMEWKDIHLARAEWRIERTKNGEAMTVPLPPEAIRVLEERKTKKKDSDKFVFPGTGKKGHLVEPKSGWERVLSRANLSNLRIHDLRRTLGSWQAKTGSSLVIIGKTLGHKNVATTQIYARLDSDPIRESVNKAVEAIMQAATTPISSSTDIADNFSSKS
ncbi:site-specific integrase [Herbaspirillum sp. YR522]|uniref:tyrosine-type recombinase/integrase n=1 Tax=Herbaspirillum sp. YR522 TaxID=1144342 RepID=UPI00026FC49D|nr:site-specific integrase [Herbaspirillum sp. YR522]EJN07612.1 site-specific recombinase XerD [Herbaspirillum sp. YR522]